MNKKLVIWDFDGVIADSEKIYIENRQQLINKTFGLNWSIQKTFDHIGGLSDILNRKILDELGYITNDSFWKDLLIIDKERMLKGDMKVTPNIEKLMQKLPKQCIATNSLFENAFFKLKLIKFWNKYFNKTNVFTGDMVKHYKPEPDLFLLAAEKMGEKPQDCIVIEDSIAGLTAAQKAGMETIAFLGCEIYRDNKHYLEKIKKMNIKNICYNIQDIEHILVR